MSIIAGSRTVENCHQDARAKVHTASCSSITGIREASISLFYPSKDACNWTAQALQSWRYRDSLALSRN